MAERSAEGWFGGGTEGKIGGGRLGGGPEILDAFTLFRELAARAVLAAEAVLEAYNAGQRVFGENLVQEMVDKQAQLPADIEWHLIGHLQTNKVKYIAVVSSFLLF